MAYVCVVNSLFGFISEYTFSLLTASRVSSRIKFVGGGNPTDYKLYLKVSKIPV